MSILEYNRIADPKIMVLNLPSPPYMDVTRQWAGGFGTAQPCVRRNDFGHSGKPTLDPFLPYAASVLKIGRYEFSILDGQALNLTSSEVVRSVKKTDPDIIVSVIGLPSMNKDLQLLDQIKKQLPNAVLVGAGTVCRVMPDQVLLKSEVDVVLSDVFPYVSDLINLIQAFQKKNFRLVPGISYVKQGNIISNPTKSSDNNLDELPSPNYDVLPLKKYDNFVDASNKKWPFISILGSRGCSYGCIYCPYPIGFGNKWAHRKPENIVDEIEHLRTCHNVQGFLFRDQSFAMNIKHATKICNEIIRRKLDIAWFCEARVDEVSLQLLRKMKKAGCKRVHYGVETGDATLIRIGKPGIDLTTIRRAFHTTKEIGILTLAHVIIGLPHESKKTLRKTYKFITDLDPDAVNWNILTPYPGTKLYEMARRNSWIVTYDWSRYTSHTAIMKTNHLSTVELQKEKLRMMLEFEEQKVKKLLTDSLYACMHGKPNLSLLMEYISRFLSLKIHSSYG